MASEIIPTVFSTNKKEFEKRFELLIKIAKSIQIDIMDGKFVNAKSIKIEEIPNLKKYKNQFEAHLMTKDPAKLLIELRKKGFKKIIFHYEAVPENKIEEIINLIKYLEMEPVLAVNPETKIQKIIPYMKKLKKIQLMGIKPGKEGQTLKTQTYKRIKALKEINNKLKIQIDGGVNEKTAKKLKESGADILSTGSYIMKSKNPIKAIKILESA